jgi:hypothetical protein
VNVPALSWALSSRACHHVPSGRHPGRGWLHEIKHDGFRIMARRDGAGVKLITRHGNDFTSRFPIIVAAVTALPAQSFLIDGEAIVTNGDGLAVFDLIRHKRHGGAAVLCAFDLIELDGEDLRRSTASANWPSWSAGLSSGLCSMSITRAMAKSFSSMPASSAARASFRSDWARCIAPGGHRIGSRSKIRKRLR